MAENTVQFIHDEKTILEFSATIHSIIPRVNEIVSVPNQKAEFRIIEIEHAYRLLRGSVFVDVKIYVEILR